jgi:hypothetical protein
MGNFTLLQPTTSRPDAVYRKLRCDKGEEEEGACRLLRVLLWWRSWCVLIVVVRGAVGRRCALCLMVDSRVFLSAHNVTVSLV